jgi:8-oxo-dGTP pyrophosphatase MutT (NUDIX family)
VESFLEKVRQALHAHPPRAVNLPGLTLRESAVLVPLRSHAGQIAFPGGARDPEDETPLHAALREADEELGIPPHAVTVLGQLDEVPTLTEFRIAPFVGLVPASLPFRPSPHEVAEVFEVPLRHLLAPGVHRTEKREAAGRVWDVDFYPWGHHTIWGATARIVRNLLLRVRDVLPPPPDAG